MSEGLREKVKAVFAEPALVYRSPEPNCGHDYHPEWDYALDESPDPALTKLARAVCEWYYEETGDPFELWAAVLDPSVVGVYINGTESYPTILIDFGQHFGYEDQIGQTIRHELRHAAQQRAGLEFDEDDAENGEL